MEALLVNLVFGVIIAFIAKEKGRSFGKWWLYGTLLWPIALIHSLVMKSRKISIEESYTGPSG